MRRTDAFAALAVLAASLPGCGAPAEKFVPVSGTVTVNDRPLTRGRIIFVPDAPELLPYGMGDVAADGTYTLATNGRPGAKVGPYKVVVEAFSNKFSTSPTWVPVWMVDVPYTRAETTPLRVDVVEAPAAGAYDLRATKE